MTGLIALQRAASSGALVIGCGFNPCCYLVCRGPRQSAGAANVLLVHGRLRARAAPAPRIPPFVS